MTTIDKIISIINIYIFKYTIMMVPRSMGSEHDW